MVQLIRIFTKFFFTVLTIEINFLMQSNLSDSFYDIFQINKIKQQTNRIIIVLNGKYEVYISLKENLKKKIIFKTVFQYKN